MHRTVAVGLVVVLSMVNFAAATPLVPTLPHHSWSLARWLMPWPVQVAQAAEGPEASGEYVAAVGYQDLERVILGLILGYLFNWFADGWGGLVDWFFYP